jgi:lipid II:glycine glycyltransferase (peptidoglycan interpeptide bridge formation enzyme)
MYELERGYLAVTEKCDKAKWHDIVAHFDDANIYQTWSYDAVRGGEDSLSHVVLKKGGKIVAAAQARIMKIPFLRSGIAYMRWGPLWKIKGEDRNIDVFRQAIRALRNQYVERQGLILRILPVLFRDEDRELQSILGEEGYKGQDLKAEHRTLLLDLRPSLQDLRKNFHQKWRNQLHQAEKKQLDIIEGESDQLFVMFIQLYQELLKRKKFAVPNNIYEFRSIQKDLPNNLKMRIFLARSQAGIGSGAICSSLGNKGIYLFGATNQIGMSTKGSYLVQWRIIQWLKEIGCVWYDLNSINPRRNPGTYHFKAGIAGKNGRDVYFQGAFESYNTIKGYFISVLGNYYLSHYRSSRLFKHIKALFIPKNAQRI